MEKRTSILLLTLLSLALVVPAINMPRRVEAWSGDITINADGTIQPAGAPIQHVGNVYTLTDDIQVALAIGINVKADNIVIDGAGHTIQGPPSIIGGSGIALDGMGDGLPNGGVVIKNLRFNSLEYGVYFVGPNDCIVTSNIFFNDSYGICLGYPGWHYGGGDNHILTDNTISSCGTGIYMIIDDDITVSGNTISDCSGGILGIVQHGDTIIDNDITNTVEEAIFLDSSTYCSIIGNRISSNGGGVLIETGNFYGPHTTSNNNTIADNLIELNLADGIRLIATYNNTITGNNIRYNDGNGTSFVMEAYQSDNPPYDMIDYYCVNNTVTGNNIVGNNEYGLSLHAESPMTSPSRNRIYHNNFIGNTQGNALLGTTAVTVDTFDDSYPSGGNYWSDYIDLDLYSGPAQNQPGSDGIWDHARVLDAHNADNYPLAYPWQSTRRTLFSDGFESGTFSKWSGTSTTSGETAQVQSSRIYAGTYSARFTSNGGGWYERSCAYKRIIPSSDLSAQGLFYVSRSGISDNNDRFFFIVFRAGTSNLAYAGWRRINGVTRWCLTMRDGTGYVNVYSSARPVPSRWYMVQLHWIGDSTTGLGELWVNGVRVCIATGRNTATYGNANDVRFGLPELYSCRRTTIHCDNCQITTPT